MKLWLGITYILWKSKWNYLKSWNYLEFLKLKGITLIMEISKYFLELNGINYELLEFRFDQRGNCFGV